MTFFVDNFTGSVALLGSHTPDAGGAQWVPVVENPVTNYIALNGSGLAYARINDTSDPSYTSDLLTPLSAGTGVRITASFQMDSPPSAAQSLAFGTGAVELGCFMEPDSLFTTNYISVTAGSIGNILEVHGLNPASGAVAVDLIIADGVQSLSINGSVVATNNASVTLGAQNSVSLSMSGRVSGSGEYVRIDYLTVDPYDPFTQFWQRYHNTVETA